MTPTTYAPTDSQPWQSVVDTLERAAAACHARGGSDDVADEHRISWLQHCMAIEDAAYDVRAALPFELADTVATIPAGLTAAAADDRPGTPAEPAGQTASMPDVPLTLMQRACEDLTRLQDDPYWLGNVPMLLASLEVADALTAVRAHYE